MTFEDKIRAAFGDNVRTFGEKFSSPSYVKRLVHGDLSCQLIIDELVSGFSWYSTKQGYAFWRRVVAELARGERGLWESSVVPLLLSVIEEVEIPALEDML